MKPLISIIVNCRNGSKYLEKCLISIKSQKLQDWELIFYDNNSTDDSFKIYQKIKNDKFRYYKSTKTETLYKARNLACRASKGKYIAFLDVDDWWDEEYLSSRYEALQNEEYDFFYSNALFYLEKKNKFEKYKNFDLPNGIIFKNLAKDYFVIISGLIVKKIIIEKENFFNENYNIIGDFDFIMRISRYSKAHALNKPLLFYRVHKNNFSKLNTEIFYREYYNWFEEQEIRNDKLFFKYKKYFKKKLLELEINFLLLNTNKNINLILKILKFPEFIRKIKYLVAFCLPKEIIRILKK